MVTWNCATLFGAAPRNLEQRRRHAAKIDRVVSLAGRHDVVMLQEVHGNSEDIGELASRITRHSFFGSFCRDSGSGGVLIIISEELRGRFTSCRSEEVERGRALLVTLEGGGLHPLAFCCLHMVPEWSVGFKRNFLDRVSGRSPKVGDACLVLGGDLNFPAVGEGRLNVNTGRVSLSDEAVSAHFDNVFPELCEILGDRPTRRGFINGVLSVVSRIDRVFMNMLPSELLSRNASVCVLDDLNCIDLLSDHSPVLFSVGAVSRGGRCRGGVPGWVAERHDFPEHVSEQFERSMTCLVEEPFDRLRRYKEAMSRAATIIIGKASAVECAKPASRLFWITAARSAVRARSSSKLARAVERFPGLCNFFNCEDCVVSDPSGLHTLVCDINREDLRDQLAEVEASDLSEDDKNRKRSKFHTRLSSWSPKGKSVIGVSVLTEDGDTTNEKGAFEALKSHWEPVFNNTIGDRRAMNDFSRHVQRCPEGIVPLSRIEFREICGVARRSAPGPDGIGYMSWRAGGEEAADVVFECYRCILEGGEVPGWFNESTLVFIPKGDPGAGGVGVQARPGDLRPLSLSNADQKLVALAINISLSRICESVVHDSQRGFRKGKVITDNVIELEARIMKELYTGARCPALLLIDIKAAFPSVAWDWLWHVLDLMVCPEWLVCAVKALYVGSSAQLAAGGLRGVLISITSGIKQGCPMSGSLWCLIFDPIIRALVELVGEDGSLSAFADDIGISVGDIIRI